MKLKVFFRTGQGDLEAARKEAAERAAERDAEAERLARERQRAERLQEQLEVGGRWVSFVGCSAV